MLADFGDAMEEAERTRTLSIMGMHELARASERTTPEVDPQTAWERARWAQAELDNDTPHLNAQALISMFSALDAMVESLANSWREFHSRHIVRQILTRVREGSPKSAAELSTEEWATVEQAVKAEVDRMLPRIRRLKGSGVARYERALRRVGWGAQPDRSIPPDLDEALKELGALRDVLMHRAGRVDEIALASAPTLSYEVGQFVRISGAEYRLYSAAIRCYAQEIAFRGIRSWPEVSDETDGPRLADWRDYYVIGA